MADVYRRGAPLYEAAGWARFVPLDKGKGVVPRGVSGHRGADPTPEQRAKWLRYKADANGCIIVPEGVIGLDTDHYIDPSGKVKRGGDTLILADTKWGPRPATVRSTSRTDGVSGIYLYRVPDGTPKLPGQIKFVLDDGTELADIEIVQHHHRNVNCWPSVHHGTGRQYQWLDDDDNIVGIPAPRALPMLSDTWVAGLLSLHRGGGRPTRRSDRPHVHHTASEAHDAVVSARTDGVAGPTVAARLEQALAELEKPGCRYDSMVRHTMALLRHGYNGRPGVDAALNTYSDAYYDAVAMDRDGVNDAIEEFERAIRGAGALLLADDDFTPSTEHTLPPSVAQLFNVGEDAPIVYRNTMFDDFETDTEVSA